MGVLMVTLVGTQFNLADALKDLIELEYDAIEAYEAAYNRLRDENYKNKISEFKADHLKHVASLSELLKKHGETAPTGPSLINQWLTKGKVVISNIIGDKQILSAMNSNEADTNSAYDRISAREDLWDDSVEMINEFYSDEKKHKAWLEAIIKAEN